VIIARKGGRTINEGAFFFAPWREFMPGYRLEYAAFRDGAIATAAKFP